ncbi:MAG: hypothetical protein LC798_03500 [Chloroflexi bacterium]|nr:hypothetical protein [Chloroflexota bacterium]
MAKKDETDIRQDDVRDEHLGDVHIGAHWAYLGIVMVGGSLLMIALIGSLGATGG